MPMTALQEFHEITETLSEIHNASQEKGGTKGNAFYNAMRNRQGSLVMTPGQVSLLKDKATITLQQMFNEAAADGNAQSMIHDAIRHASRDPLVKICFFVHMIAELQQASGRGGKPVSPASLQKQNERVVHGAHALALCLEDMVSNFKTIMPPGDKKDLYALGLSYKESVIPKLHGIFPRLAQEFGIPQSRLNEIKAEGDKNYDNGAEHLRRINPADWQKQGLSASPV